MWLLFLLWQLSISITTFWSFVSSKVFAISRESLAPVIRPKLTSLKLSIRRRHAFWSGPSFAESFRTSLIRQLKKTSMLAPFLFLRLLLCAVIALKSLSSSTTGSPESNASMEHWTADNNSEVNFSSWKMIRNVREFFRFWRSEIAKQYETGLSAAV